MRKFLDHVDATLIDRVFQPLVDWSARHLLIDCFQLARICINVAAVSWILSQLSAVTAAVRSGMVGLQVFEGTVLLLGLGSIMVLYSLFQRFGGAGRRGQANPLRAAMYVHRCCLLLALMVNIGRVTAGLGSLALLAVGVFTTMAVYVGSCSNPPPEQREVLWGLRLARLPR